MTRQVTLSAVQPPLHRRETLAEAQETHLAAVTELLLVAASRNTDLAVLPEHINVVGATLRHEEYRAASETLDGPFTRAMRRLAASHRMAIVLPIYRVDDAGCLRNTAMIIDRAGAIVGCYDKVHPTRGELDSRGVVPGDTWPVFELHFGKIGVMICHDNSFPEAARCLALNGAEVICWPHVQSGWGDIVWDITLRSRAIDNGVYVVSSCFAVRGDGAWKPGMMQGRSGVAGEDGFILAEMSREPGVATATVDLDRPRLVHSWTRSGEYPYAEEFRIDRRPDTYDAIVEPKDPAWAALAASRTSTIER